MLYKYIRMLKMPTIPMEKLQINKGLTLTIKNPVEGTKMRMDPNIPMQNLLKQHPKMKSNIKLKTRGQQSEPVVEKTVEPVKVLEEGKKPILENVA